jgi:hypothetical protein
VLSIQFKLQVPFDSTTSLGAMLDGISDENSDPNILASRCEVIDLKGEEHQFPHPK